MQGSDPRQLRTPARVLTVLSQPVLAEVVRLALSHGQFQTRIAANEGEAMAALSEWQPHLAIIDMDVSKGELLDRLSAAPTPVGRIPVIALTGAVTCKRSWRPSTEASTTSWLCRSHLRNSSLVCWPL